MSQPDKVKSLKCRKPGCGRVAYYGTQTHRTDGYCLKHGWRNVVLKFMDTEESNLLFRDEANNPILKRAIRDAMIEMVKPA